MPLKNLIFTLFKLQNNLSRSELPPKPHYLIKIKFYQQTLKISCWDSQPVDEEEIICQYWIERVKRLFEEMKN